MVRYPDSWLNGPISDKELTPSHDRPIQAIAIQNDLAVTGSADHSLRVWSLSKGAHIRHLYNKNFGHKEWVTCCSFLQDNRIISGGMDGLLCVWDKRAVRCDNLSEHTSSVSWVMTDNHDIGISASYDKTLIVWDLHRLRSVASMTGTAPIVTFIWNNSLLASGQRDGKVQFWDVNTGQNFYNAQNHTNSIHKMCFNVDGGNNNVIASCGKDGKVSVIDIRDNNCVYSKQIHKGAVNFISGSLSNNLITASADCSIKVLDMFMGFNIRSSVAANSAVFCGEVIDNLFACGCADGNFIVYNLDTGEPCFGIGVDNVGGVNCIGVTENRKKVITGGDKGMPLMLDF